MALCERCDKFDVQGFSKSNSTLKFDVTETKAAAEAGCDFCSLLFEHVDKTGRVAATKNGRRGPLRIQLSIRDSTSKQAEEPSSPRASLQIKRFFASIAPQVHSEWLSEKTWPMYVDRGLCVVADPDSPAARSGDVIGRLLDPCEPKNRGDTIREWLAGCLEHSKCKETASGDRIDVWNSPLPTRCIELADSVGDSLFLRETDRQPGFYVTLTHRWNGQTNATQTTTSNYGRRKEGNFGFLPEVFRNAIQVAAEQGIRYIWIDSLCIIQDGDGGADWRIEALNMADYYQNAVFTVVAAVTSPFEGLFRPQRPERLVRLPYRDKEDDRNGYFFVFQRTDPLDTLYARMDAAEIFWRGWIFQEWMLSRRLVNFTDWGIFFTCQSTAPVYDSLETVPVNKGDSSSSGGTTAALPPSMPLKTYFNSQASVQELWYRLMTRYSGLSLTKKEEDRIVAVAGVARECRKLLTRSRKVKDLRYAAGLWMWDIHQGLLWQITSSRAKRVTVSSAPSWSWSSVITIVDWPHRGTLSERILTRHACEISLSTETDGDSLDRPFASLSVRGRLLPVVVRQHVSSVQDGVEMLSASGFRFMSTVIKELFFRAVCSLSSPGLIGGWGSFENEGVLSRLAVSPGTSLFALHVQTRHLVSSPYSGVLGSLLPITDTYDVIYLDPVPGMDDTYRRVGAGRLFEPELLKEFKGIKMTQIKLV